MMYNLKTIGKIRVNKDGHVELHKGPGLVSVDQYLTLTSKPRPGQGATSSPGQRSMTKRGDDISEYPYYCELCKVLGNSDVSYKGHLNGIRHRYQLVVKAVGTRR